MIENRLTEKTLHGLTDFQLIEYRDSLKVKEAILKDRVALDGTKNLELQIKGLGLRLDMLRSEYLMIDTYRHSNIVLADFLFLQGQEREVIAEMEEIATAKDRKKGVDSDLQICENILKKRQEQATRS